jgi:hypothetical protein
MGIVMAIALVREIDFAYSGRSYRGLFRTLVFILSLAEFFVYEFCPEAIFLDPLVNSFGGLVAMVILAAYAALQARMIHVLSQAYLLDGDRAHLTGLGYGLLGVSLILILLALPLRFLRTFVVILVLLGLVIRLFLDIADTSFGSFNFGKFIGNTFWFLVCAAGFMSVALMMIPYYTFGRFLLAGLAAWLVVGKFFFGDLDAESVDTRMSEETIRENAMRRERRKAARQEFKDYMRGRSADRARAAAEAEEEARRNREENYPSPSDQVCENCRFYEYSGGHCSYHSIDNVYPRDDCSHWEWNE